MNELSIIWPNGGKFCSKCLKLEALRSEAKTLRGSEFCEDCSDKSEQDKWAKQSLEDLKRILNND